MEPNTPNQSVPPPPIPPPASQRKSSVGGLFAIVIILIAIVIGALYFWGERISKEPVPLENIESQSDSTDPVDIESDLQSQTPDEFDASVDAALNDLDASFDTSQ